MSENFITGNQLQELANAVACKVAINTKEVLTFEEACSYTGMSKSGMYKRTMSGGVPCYKPSGKMLFFNRRELEQWLQSNKIAPADEINQRAAAYCMKKGGGR